MSKVPLDQQPLPAFCLGLLHVSQVDYLELFSQSRKKMCLLEGGAWQEEEINP